MIFLPSLLAIPTRFLTLVHRICSSLHQFSADSSLRLSLPLVTPSTWFSKVSYSLIVLPDTSTSPCSLCSKVIGSLLRRSTTFGTFKVTDNTVWCLLWLIHTNLLYWASLSSKVTTLIIIWRVTSSHSAHSLWMVPNLLNMAKNPLNHCQVLKLLTFSSLRVQLFTLRLWWSSTRSSLLLTSLHNTITIMLMSNKLISLTLCCTLLCAWESSQQL